MRATKHDPGQSDRPFAVETEQLRSLTSLVLIAMVVVATAAILFGQAHAVSFPPFIPAVISAFIVTESISGYVFFGHYRTRREPRYFVFALAFLSSAYIATAYMLTFPGVFSASGLFGATPQTGVYLWLCWHSVFPILILIGALLGAKVARQPRFGTSLVSAATLAGVAVAGAALTWMLLRFGAVLPVLAPSGALSTVARWVVAPAVCALDIAAIAALLHNRRAAPAMSLWLVVSIAASALDTMMGVLSARYSYCWYVGKLFSVTSSTVILTAFVFEMLDLQRRLSETTRDLRDIREAERRSASARLMHLAYHDRLTGLLNRGRWQELVVERFAAIGSGTARAAAILLIDLDEFSEINDLFGQAEGDAILLEAASRLRRAVRAECKIARYGGDEFAVLLEDDVSEERLDGLAARVVDALRLAPFAGRQEIVVTASVGAASTSGVSGAATFDELVQHAAVALNCTKRAGGNHSRRYDAQMGAEIERARVLKEALVRAVRRGGFIMQYQPLISLARGDIAGVEALMRWDDPEQGLIAPGTFIPLAEDTGLMESLGKWTLETTIAQARAWNDAGCRLKISVNASVKQLQDGTFFKHLASTLASNAVPASQIEIEVTESAAMKDSDRIIEVLERCRQLGTTVALDDYGTHYSSLTYLQRLPIDTIKIDGSFVKGLPSNDRDASIIRSVISLGHELGKMIVAEGVETVEQLRWLRENKCDVVQGFFYAHPMLARDVAGWVASRQLHAAS